jgi:hypothetical protein
VSLPDRELRIIGVLKKRIVKEQNSMVFVHGPGDLGKLLYLRYGIIQYLLTDPHYSITAQLRRAHEPVASIRVHFKEFYNTTYLLCSIIDLSCGQEKDDEQGKETDKRLNDLEFI